MPDISEVAGDEEAISSFQPIEDLQAHGINAADLQKMRASGLTTILSVAQTPRRNLAKIKGLSEAKIEKIKELCTKLLPPTFATATEISLRRENVVYISTGSKAVDAIVGGGIATQQITEIYGEFRTGKTQLCHTMAVTVQLPLDMGGGAGKFRPDRLKAVAERFGVDPRLVQENVIVGRAWSSRLNIAGQIEMLSEIAQRFADDGSFRLLIVDSVMALFRQDYSGRGELSERQQKLQSFLSRLAKLSEEFNIAVVITNQVQSDPGANAMFAAAATVKPVGGHVLSHASAVRMQLRKGRGDERIAKLVDSPDCPEGEATYALRTGGWEGRVRIIDLICAGRLIDESSCGTLADV